MTSHMFCHEVIYFYSMADIFKPLKTSIKYIELIFFYLGLLSKVPKPPHKGARMVKKEKNSVKFSKRFINWGPYKWCFLVFTQNLTWIYLQNGSLKYTEISKTLTTYRINNK